MTMLRLLQTHPCAGRARGCPWSSHGAGRWGPAPWRGGNLCSRGLVSRGVSFIHVLSEAVEMGVPKVPGTWGLEQLDSFCPVCLGQAQLMAFLAYTHNF